MVPISSQDTLTSLFTREAGRTAGIPGSKEPGLSSETQLSGPGVFAGDLVPRDRLSLSEQRVESVSPAEAPSSLSLTYLHNTRGVRVWQHWEEKPPPGPTSTNCSEAELVRLKGQVCLAGRCRIRATSGHCGGI